MCLMLLLSQLGSSMEVNECIASLRLHFLCLLLLYSMLCSRGNMRLTEHEEPLTSLFR